ncbi:MAG: twitching motility protein PilT [Ignavibacteria bacterium]|nr:twitching motility protein PilT [Ignavibacteria bacterium]
MFIETNTKEFEILVKDVREIISNLNENVPKEVRGVEKILFCRNFLEEMNLVKRAALRKFVESILFDMHRVEASDLDFGGAGGLNKFWMRIHGNKKPMGHLPEFTNTEMNVFILNVLTEKQTELLLQYRNLDFSIDIREEKPFLREYRYRADSYFEIDELSLNVRAILATIRPFSALELHPSVAKLMNINFLKEGMILVTGITGSGKSSTLDSIIDENNHASNGHIIIISSPIEYIHKSDKCIVRHREVGRDVLSFKEGTIQALRQDPDIIVIGELRDNDTIVAALDVTDSGHKVFSTLHTSSAVETLDRIIGEIEVNEQERVRVRLADVLRCIVSQKLVPTVDGKRALAKEVLVVTSSVKSAIRNNNTTEIYQMIHQGNEHGMITMEQDLTRLYRQRRITYETAISYANQKTRIQQLLASKM